MSLYELTESAATDLRDIIAYLAEHAGEATASRIEDELFAKFESLAANSGQGHVRSDLTTFPLVFFPIGPFLIVYQRERVPILIHAVFHGVRDVKRHLKLRAGRRAWPVSPG
jgi:plasmid stabilization system protein ParE